MTACEIRKRLCSPIVGSGVVASVLEILERVDVVDKVKVVTGECKEVVDGVLWDNRDTSIVGEARVLGPRDAEEQVSWAHGYSVILTQFRDLLQNSSGSKIGEVPSEFKDWMNALEEYCKFRDQSKLTRVLDTHLEWLEPTPEPSLDFFNNLSRTMDILAMTVYTVIQYPGIKIKPVLTRLQGLVKKCMDKKVEVESEIDGLDVKGCSERVEKEWRRGLQGCLTESSQYERHLK